MPTNKPEVVLPEAPPIPAHLFDKDQSIVWAAAWETLRKHVADTLTRPAVPQQSGQEVVAGVKLLNDVERNSLNDLLSNLEHEAGDVEDLPPSIEDDDAYWPYHQWHAITKLLRRENAPVSATQPQQPAEAVAVTDSVIVEILRKHLLPHERAAYDHVTFERSPPMFPQESYDVPTIGMERFAKELVERCANPQPPAIDIGKLRELMKKWRADASRDDSYQYTRYEEGRLDEKLARANELAALIGDGGEKGNG